MAVSEGLNVSKCQKPCRPGVPFRMGTSAKEVTIDFSLFCSERSMMVLTGADIEATIAWPSSESAFFGITEAEI